MRGRRRVAQSSCEGSRAFLRALPVAPSEAKVLCIKGRILTLSLPKSQNDKDYDSDLEKALGSVNRRLNRP